MINKKNKPINPNKIKSLKFLKYNIKIIEKIDIYTNKVPISGWRSSNIITILIFMKLINRYSLLLVLIYK